MYIYYTFYIFVFKAVQKTLKQNFDIMILIWNSGKKMFKKKNF